MPNETVTPIKSDIEISLDQISVFQKLDAALLQGILSHSQTRSLQRGDFLFHHDQPALMLYVLQKGSLRLLQHTQRGKDVCLRIFSPGELIAFMALMQPGEFPGTVQAIKPSKVLAIPGDYLRGMMLDYPAFAVAMLEVVINRLHAAHDRIREMATEAVEQRIARNLLQLTRRLGKTTPAGILIDIPLTRQDIAEINGTRLETVSRVLRHWQQQGIVSSRREEITICDLAALKTLADP